jgi:2-polyprenyl-3-methyl-5-hydroxy-6-metoxy-1,4-benzoquinol methylase
MATDTRPLLTLGPSASEQWRDAPDHLAMVLARYRAASALIGTSQTVLEVGCGEGIGARILARGRHYLGIDSDETAIAHAHGVFDFPGDGAFTRQIRVSAVEALVGIAPFDAVVALDVIEHVALDDEWDFIEAVVGALVPSGVCVIGTPSAAFDHLASARSREAHVNTYTHARLLALMARHFRVVQSFGMADTALHLGHPDARHYLLMCGLVPR